MYPQNIMNYRFYKKARYSECVKLVNKKCKSESRVGR